MSHQIEFSAGLFQAVPAQRRGYLTVDKPINLELAHILSDVIHKKDFSKAAALQVLRKELI